MNSVLDYNESHVGTTRLCVVDKHGQRRWAWIVSVDRDRAKITVEYEDDNTRMVMGLTDDQKH